MKFYTTLALTYTLCVSWFHITLAQNEQDKWTPAELITLLNAARDEVSNNPELVKLYDQFDPNELAKLSKEEATKKINDVLFAGLKEINSGTGSNAMDNSSMSTDASKSMEDIKSSMDSMASSMSGSMDGSNVLGTDSMSSSTSSTKSPDDVEVDDSGANALTLSMGLVAIAIIPYNQLL